MGKLDYLKFTIVIAVLFLSMVSVIGYSYTTPFEEENNSNEQEKPNSTEENHQPTNYPVESVASPIEADLANYADESTSIKTLNASELPSFEEIEGFEESDEKKCEDVRGCYVEDHHLTADEFQEKNSLEGCYPFGYRVGGKACTVYEKEPILRTKFVYQKNNSQKCNYSFECKSNICYKGECFNKSISRLEKENEILKERNKEFKQKISKLENETSLLKNRLGSLEKKFEEYKNKTINVPITGSAIGLQEKPNNTIIGFFRNLFS